MRLYIDISTGKWIREPAFSSPVTKVDYKRGDTSVLEIGFVQDNALVLLTGSVVIKFGLKEQNKYDADFLVSHDDFAEDTGRLLYIGTPNFNTVPLNDLLNHDDADDTNDIAYADTMQEVTYSTDGGVSWASTNTITARVNNDVVKGNEGIPVTGNPIYPDAADVQVHPAEGAFVDGDKTKLDSIESGATGDQTDGEIKTAYENNANTNAFTDSEKTNLSNQSGTNTGDQDLSALQVKPTAVADKATAYALTGVAVGTVYKTADTGQILEKVDHVPAIQQGFVISDAGSPVGFGSIDLTLGVFEVTPANGNYANSVTDAAVEYGGGIWTILSGGSIPSFESDPCASTVHPTDATGWTTVNGATGTIADVTGITVLEPRNWKHDGTILVRDNDEKQLLTNLPDTQQVEIVGEGGRIERFNGDKQGIVMTEGYSFRMNGGTYTNGGTQTLLSENTLIHARLVGVKYWLAFTPAEINSELWSLDIDASNSGGTANKWGIRDEVFAGNTLWESLEDSDTVHPADATWVAVGNGVTSPTFTRAPEATESNWFAIKNTYEVKVYNDNAATFLVNGVSCGPSVFTNVGWMVADEGITTNYSANPLIVVEIDGVGLVPEPPTLLTGGRCFLQTSVHARALITLYISG